MVGVAALLVSEFWSSQDRDPQAPRTGSGAIDPAWVCDLVLFLSGDFTSIEFLDMVVTADDYHAPRLAPKKCHVGFLISSPLIIA